MRNRACGVVIRDSQILMVRHVHDGHDYWTLPGGGIDGNETKFMAAKREILEETGLHVEAIRYLFSHESPGSISHCILMTSPSDLEEPVLGTDPEEAHLPLGERMLRDVAWKELAKLEDDPMVSKVIREFAANEA